VAQRSKVGGAPATLHGTGIEKSNLFCQPHHSQATGAQLAQTAVTSTCMLLFDLLIDSSKATENTSMLANN
jgi:hypothetical protein